MSEYYGITTPTDDFLTHYGIKGMKWGVRKAIDSGNYNALSRQYRKASRKLAKLDNRANRQHQQNIAKAASRDQKISAALGAGSAGIAGGMTLASLSNASRTARNMASKYGIGFGTGNIYLPVGVVPAAASLIGNQIRKRKALNRASDYGHKQAVKEANEFRNEMKKAFKGTEFSRKINDRANAISKKSRDRTATYLNKYDRSLYARAEELGNKKHNQRIAKQQNAINNKNIRNKETQLGLQNATRNFGLIGAGIYAARNRDAVRQMNADLKKKRRG